MPDGVPPVRHYAADGAVLWRLLPLNVLCLHTVSLRADMMCTKHPCLIACLAGAKTEDIFHPRRLIDHTVFETPLLVLTPLLTEAVIKEI